MGELAALASALVWATLNTVLRGQSATFGAGAAKTAIIGGASPIFGMIGAILFLHERPGRRGIAGALLAFAGIVLVLWEALGTEG